MAKKDTQSDLRLLMKAAQKGDNTSYAKLLREITPIVRSIVNQRWRGRREMVEDIVQDVLLSVHRARHTYDPRRPFRPWLYAITRYRVVEAVRAFTSKESKEIYSGQDYLETFTDNTANSKEVNLEERDLIEKSLRKLPKKQRDAVRLVKLEGLSMAEAAVKMGMSVSAVKVNAHRAYKSLKTIMAVELK